MVITSTVRACIGDLWTLCNRFICRMVSSGGIDDLLCLVNQISKGFDSAAKQRLQDRRTLWRRGYTSTIGPDTHCAGCSNHLELHATVLFQHATKGSCGVDCILICDAQLLRTNGKSEDPLPAKRLEVHDRIVAPTCD